MATYRRIGSGILGRGVGVVAGVVAGVLSHDVGPAGRDVGVGLGRIVVGRVGGVAEALDVEVAVVEDEEDDADQEGEEHDDGGQLVVPGLLVVDADEPDGHQERVLQEHGDVEGDHLHARLDLLQVDVAEDVDDGDQGAVAVLLQLGHLVAVEHVARRDQPEEHAHPVQSCIKSSNHQTIKPSSSNQLTIQFR